MPVPSSISDLSTTPGSNSPAGSESPNTADDYLRTYAAFIKQTYNALPSSTNPLPADSLSDGAVGKVLQAAYPVGSVYINASNNTNPATLLGFGSWVAFGAGRVPVGFDASDSLFNAAEKTGGSKDAVVVSHTHTATVTDPGHSHASIGDVGGSLKGFAATDSDNAQNFTTGVATTGITVTNGTTGVSGTNANVQPYITVYMWKRTA